MENFGFENTKRLEGNIGYINFKGFAEPKSSEIALTSAMNFVSNTNSCIQYIPRNNRLNAYEQNNRLNLYESFGGLPCNLQLNLSSN